MAKEIKIGVDVGSVKRSIFDISKSFDKAFNKGKGFDIFTKADKKFLLGQAAAAVVEVKKEMGNLTKEAEKYRKELDKATKGSERHLQIQQRLLNIARDTSKLHETAEDLEAGSASIKRGGVGRVGKMLTRIPGVGPLASKMMESGVSVGALGATVALGAIFSRLSGGYGAFANSVPQRFGLMQRGISDVSGASKDSLRMGFNPNEVRSAQEQGIGIFGTGANQTGSKELNDRLKLSRMTGIGVEQIQGAFSGTQAQGGFKGANKAIEEFKATIFADKLTHEMAPYLEATNDLLGEMNQDGMGLTGEAIRSIATIAGKGENVSAQQAARMIGGIDSVIKNSQGPVRAFYMNAFAKSGIGGHTLGGADVATKMGLFGGDLEGMQRYKEQGLLSEESVGTGGPNGKKGLYQRLGLAGAGTSRTKAQAIGKGFELIDKLYKTTPGMSENKKNNILMAKHQAEAYLTGGNTPLEGEARRSAIEKIANAKTDEEAEKGAKKFEDEFGEKTLEQLMKTSEGHLTQIESSSQAVKESLGKDISGPILDIQQILIDIDVVLRNILGPIADIASVITKPLSMVTGQVAKGMNALPGLGANLGSGIYSATHPGMGSRLMGGGYSADEVSGMGSVDRGDLETAAKKALEDIRFAESQAKGKAGMEMTGQALDRKDKELTQLLEMIKTINAEQLKTLQDQYKHSKASHEENRRNAGKPKAEKNPNRHLSEF